MPNHKIELSDRYGKFITLEDILPELDMPLKLLFVGKVPIGDSVDAGHYFQGNQGQWFWNKLREYHILNTPRGIKDDTGEDDYLLPNGFGMIDLRRKPLPYGTEPRSDDYIEGSKRLNRIVQQYKPKVLAFIYKKTLDRVLRKGFYCIGETCYGFNDEYNTFFHNSRVFAMPMPGIKECSREIIKSTMKELENYLGTLH